MKFDSAGNALPYPGNTIICSVPSGTPCHAALIQLQRGLEASPSAAAFAFLPPGSFHMTLFRGVNHRRRLAEEWPRDLPLDMPLAEATGEFSRRLNGVALPAGFRMRPLRLYTNPTGESQLAMEGADDAEKQKLRVAREGLMRALNHERPGDRNYTFHITFTYRVRPLSDDEQARLDELQRRLFGELVARAGIIDVGGPELCRYDDMMAFHPVLRLFSGAD